jgi:hypothetical protein
MLSPHTFLLGMLFRNDAFKAPNLKSMEDLRRLFLEGGRQQMPLPLKREKADYYVFCRVEAKRGKVTVNPKLPITPSTLSAQIKDFGEIAGFLWSLFTHRFRYGGGAIMNASGKFSISHIPMSLAVANLGVDAHVKAWSATRSRT